MQSDGVNSLSQSQNGDERVEVLVERLREGDLQALAELFDHFQPRLLRMIEVRMHWSLHARIDPFDVLQEAFIDASQRLDNFLARANSSIAVWLRLIVLQRLQLLVRYHVLTSKRDARREICASNSSSGTTETSIQHWLCDSLTSPSELMMRNESADRLMELISNMSETDREILLLRHFEQLSNEEAAEVLEISVKAASNRYVRALERLRTRLEKAPWAQPTG